MKRIDLGENRGAAKLRLQVLHVVAFQGRGATTEAELRRLSSLQDAIEAASITLPDGSIIPKADLSSLVLEDEHVEQLKARVFGADIVWTATANRQLADVVDMLESASEWKPEDAK